MGGRVYPNCALSKETESTTSLEFKANLLSPFQTASCHSTGDPEIHLWGPVFRQMNSNATGNIRAHHTRRGKPCLGSLCLCVGTVFVFSPLNSQSGSVKTQVRSRHSF